VGRTIIVPRAASSSLHSSLDVQPVPGTVRSRPIRSRIAANKVRGTATSAIGGVTAFAWVTPWPTILIHFSRRVVKLVNQIGRDIDERHGTVERALGKAKPGRRTRADAQGAEAPRR
jgi:hypothetical protein